MIGPADADPLGSVIASHARRLDIDPAVARAVLAVEAGGSGMRDGRLVIRFEVHVFERQWMSADPEAARAFPTHFRCEGWQRQRWRSSESEGWRAVHGRQSREWACLDFARALPGAEEPALCSTSMGCGQIMGYHHRLIGYPTAAAMLEALGDPDVGEARQIEAFFRFLDAADRRLVPALRGRDWPTFARWYNGSQNVDHYAEALAAAYAREIA